MKWNKNMLQKLFWLDNNQIIDEYNLLKDKYDEVCSMKLSVNDLYTGTRAKKINDIVLRKEALEIAYKKQQEQDKKINKYDCVFVGVIVLLASAFLYLLISGSIN